MHGLIDWRYLSLILGLLAGAAWVKTGRSPFVLAALGLIHCEAVRLQLIASVIVAARHFADGYSVRVQLVRDAAWRGDA
jgi:hypothetical protein